MDRNEVVKALAQAGTIELLSGKLIDANEDLGGVVCGSLFGGMSDFYTDIFYEKTEMPIRMAFQDNGVHLSIPDLDAREYGPGVLPYPDLADSELEALGRLVRDGEPSD